MIPCILSQIPSGLAGLQGEFILAFSLEEGPTSVWGSSRAAHPRCHGTSQNDIHRKEVLSLANESWTFHIGMFSAGGDKHAGT
jgi:hypothetical protein